MIGKITSFAAMLVLATPVIADDAPPKISDDQLARIVERMSDQRIEALIERYIQQHPDRIISSLARYQRDQQFSQLSASASLYRGYLENDEQIVLGNPDGDISFVEFVDYRCSFCRQHYQDMQQLITEFPRIKWLPKPLFTLDRTGEPEISLFAARAAFAAQLQGKFPEFHKAMMTSEFIARSKEDVLSFAEAAGLDIAQLTKDIESAQVNRKVLELREVAIETGFWEAGTPGILINGKSWLGAEGIDHYRWMIQDAIQETATGR